MFGWFTRNNNISAVNITNPTAVQSDGREHKWREDKGLSEVLDKPVVRHEG